LGMAAYGTPAPLNLIKPGMVHLGNWD